MKIYRTVLNSLLFYFIFYIVKSNFDTQNLNQSPTQISCGFLNVGPVDSSLSKFNPNFFVDKVGGSTWYISVGRAVKVE